MKASEIEAAEGLQFSDLVADVGKRTPRTMVPLLPMLFNLNGQPYSLREHFPFEPVFQTRIPQKLVLRTGRQLSKSTVQASSGLVRSLMIPHFGTLFVAPLYEQIRRFSSQRVKPFVEQSPIKRLLIDGSCETSVLQRTFKNNSKMYFSFLGLDADRTRGLSSDSCNFDEIQDCDPSLIPIVLETMGASKYRYQTYAGTPKTLENVLEGYWEKSSKAEWAIPCSACKHLNIPRMGYDLEKMLGPYHPGIGPLKPTKQQLAMGMTAGVPGIICSKCAHWLDPRSGAWLHERPHSRWSFAGYHVPQCIMPMHCEDPKRYAELVAKREGYNNCTTAQFYNEVLGEGYDLGSKLLSRTDLQNAATLPWDNKIEEARKHMYNYDARFLGVDWGGGGEDELSFTTAAVIGYKSDGRCDVIYGERLLTPHDHMAEATRLLQLFGLFGCCIFAHDYNGAGTTRETIMVQAGLRREQCVPITYYRSAKTQIMVYKPPTDIHPRAWWQLDKARALTLVCQAIKNGQIRSFKYDYIDDGRRGVLHDFLGLMEHKIASTRGPEVYTIVRNPAMTDDFAHAVAFACCTAWHSNAKWPDISGIAELALTQAQESAMYRMDYD